METDLNFGHEWLAGDADQRATLRRLTDEARHRLAEARPDVRVLIAEAEPLRFAAAFFAAFTSATPLRVFLGSPQWSELERSEADRAIESEVVFGARSRSGRGYEAVESACANGPPRDLGGYTAQPTETLLMIPTGGTTGGMRFAMHTRDTLATAADGLRRWLGDRPIHSVCFLPLHHVSGLMQLVRAWTSGGTVTLASWPEMEAGGFPSLPHTEAVTSLVPTQLARLLRVAGGSEWLRQFRSVFLGGAAPWPELLREAQSARIPLSPCYGMTETAAQVAAVRPEAFLADSSTCAESLPHASIEIIDERIVVSAASLFLGYWPDAPRRNERWVTADRGCLDSQGRLQVLGRADTLINTGGEKVDPAEVERALRATRLVDDVAVFGVPDPEWGEVIVAAISSARVCEESHLRASLRGQIAAHKIPKRFIVVAALPRNEAGKIDRRALTLLAAQRQSPS